MDLVPLAAGNGMPYWCCSCGHWTDLVPLVRGYGLPKKWAIMGGKLIAKQIDKGIAWRN